MTAAAVRQPTLLLIEDDPDDVLLIREILSRSSGTSSLQPHLEFAETLTDGFRRLERGGIDLVLLDLSLPESRGIETLRRFVDRHPELPVIVLTALNDESIAVEALGQGAQDYLVKGQVDGTFFLRAIRYALERHRIRRELDATKAHLEELAIVDPLTGTLNRRGLEQFLTDKIPKTIHRDRNFLALLVDLDDFKKINDQLGHAVGDVVLKEITRKMRSVLRPTDVAARIGGDEFLIVLPDTDFSEGVKFAENVRLAVGGSPIIVSSGRAIRVTASFGLISIHHERPSLDELLRETHLALSNSKRTGKNKVSYDRRGGGTSDAERAAVLSDIRVRLRRADGFQAVVQSIRRLSDLMKVGYEFLSRSVIEHFTNPEEFFRVSLENNMLTLVDRQCLKTCVAASSRLTPDMHCHLNLFPSTMMDIPIRTLLEEFPQERTKGSYCIEISEQQIIGDPSYLAKPVEELKKAGMLVAIDDVGFGRSCLENLILLEPDVIKIDKRCVGGIARDRARTNSLRKILKVAEVLDTEVVAEGIESTDDLAVLRDLGVMYGQGFLLDRPAVLA
ncbi:MAG: diguanylate cyclase [Elusimicrobia bacterium]|nr:diguanylate cyclase [Elusimicrobiota bacterium]